MGRMGIRFVSALFLAVTLGGRGCGDDGGAMPDVGPADLGFDAHVDPPDMGPACELSCEVGLRCCFDGAGEPVCVDVRSDDAHCGLCGNVCDGSNGTTCELGFCRCGSNRMGCFGTNDSTCCPPTGDRTDAYCANFTSDPEDCGGCGEVCDPATADRCGGGRCVCGADTRSACADGTACCTDVFGGVECRDLSTDRFHCGGCNRACELDEACGAGTCTLGDVVCEEGCADGEICCDGSCCRRGLCGLDGCAAEGD
jgi:hypothetical protein